MVFSENLDVIYRGMYGTIDFVCDQYVVVKVVSEKSRSAPRLLVYRENYKDIEILKASTK